MNKFILFFSVISFGISVHATGIPAADFAKTSQYLSAKLSPDGDKLGVILKIEGKRRLAVFSLPDFSPIGGANLGNRNEVGRFYWATDKRIVIEVWQRKSSVHEPKNYGELFAVNYDGSRPSLIYGYRAGQSSTGTNLRGNDATRGWADIISLLPNDKKHILISSTKMSKDKGNLATVHKLNIITGRLSNIITQAPVSFAKFISTKNGDLAFAVGKDENNDRKSFRYVQQEWQEISAQVGDKFRPLALDNSGDNLFFLDNFNQDKQGLFKLGLKTGERESVYTDDVVDVRRVSFNADRSSVYALRLDHGYPTYVIFNDGSEEADLFKSLLATFSGQRVSITSRSKDRLKWVLYVSSDTQPGSFYLYNREQNTLKALFSNMSHLNTELLANTTPFSFTSFDDKKIHGYITYPNAANQNAKVPLVTLVHGGPHGVRDYWYFDRTTQMLAAQGYAVLAINFRGSGGYGSEYLNAGYLQWGNAIQKDIIYGTKWAQSQAKVDASKACIMGASFGGYAAMMSAVIAPELFDCVIANAGVFDLNMMRTEGDIPDLLFGPSYLDTAIGNDEAQLHAFSPVNFVENLQATVLIAHGKKDRRVPFKQAESLKDALDEHNKPYEWFVKSSESHGFYDAQNRAEYFERVAQFLKKHLNE